MNERTWQNDSEREKSVLSCASDMKKGICCRTRKHSVAFSWRSSYRYKWPRRSMEPESLRCQRRHMFAEQCCPPCLHSLLHTWTNEYFGSSHFGFFIFRGLQWWSLISCYCWVLARLATLVKIPRLSGLHLLLSLRKKRLALADCWSYLRILFAT